MNNRLIKNLEDLKVSSKREKILEIAESGLESIQTEKIVRQKITLSGDILEVSGQKYNLSEYSKIYLFGFGKSACSAAVILEDILGQRLSGGAVVGVEKGTCQNVELFVGTHPKPSQANVLASEKIVEYAKGMEEDDLALVIVSGGGSSLLCYPEEECHQSIRLYEEFLETGGTIHELNVVRKHISKLKGGGLAKTLFPASVISMIFSDVPGNYPELVASGPTFKDNSTTEDAQRILDKYNLKGFSLQENVDDDKYFKKVKNFTICSNKVALEAMKNRAVELGFDSRIITDELSGEASQIGKGLAIDLHKRFSGTALIYGGETTVTVDGKGRGGRNQELVLGALKEIQKDEVILSVASDGFDNTEFAGAVGDTETLKKARKLKLLVQEFLDENNSYEFFEKTEDFINTGLTGSNVSDLIITLKE